MSKSISCLSSKLRELKSSLHSIHYDHDEEAEIHSVDNQSICKLNLSRVQNYNKVKPRSSSIPINKNNEKLFFSTRDTCPNIKSKEEIKYSSENNNYRCSTIENGSLLKQQQIN